MITRGALIISLIFILLCSNLLNAQKENLEVLLGIKWSDKANVLPHFLNNEAFKLLDERDSLVSNIRTKKDWVNRQIEVKNVLTKLIGPFPDRTPLNAKVVETIFKDDYRIEKVIFESMPELYVTAALFVPDGLEGKSPVIIHVSGHSFSSFRSDKNQQQIYNLVRKGFIVFAIDPLGQGERIQYWDNQELASEKGNGPTFEHRYFGNQMFLSGISPIRYFIWDGIRAVDYLLTRSEVDPDKIGIFGCSGGGTQTTFISAMDERIHAAVPGCYITGFRRLLETKGPQDSEQNVYNCIKYGVTHADLLEVRAPKPLLISSTTRDEFSIQGAIETYQEVKSVYDIFDTPQNVGHAVDDEGHGFYETIHDVYKFFQEAFNLPGPTNEVSFSGFETDDLKITRTGQISTSLGGKLAFDINKEESELLIEKINISRNNILQHLDLSVQKAQFISGYVPVRNVLNPMFFGRYIREGYSVEKFAIQGEGAYMIPILLFVPDTNQKTSSIIYLHPKGKMEDAAIGGKIEQLVTKGYTVAVPDLLGIGEIGNDKFRFNYNHEALMIGRSIVGIQSGDIIRVAKFLKSKMSSNSHGITAVAFDELCISLVHAAAFDTIISDIALMRPLNSYKSIVMNKEYNYDKFSKYFVAGALTSYDLSDLAASLLPRKLLIMNPVDEMGNMNSHSEKYNEEINLIEKYYSTYSDIKNFNFMNEDRTLQQQFNACVNWILNL